MTRLIQKGKKAEDLFFKYGNIPDPIFTYNAEFNVSQTIIKRQIEGVDTDKWKNNFNKCMGVSEETLTGVHGMYTMEKIGTNHQKWEMAMTEAMFAK